jgi:hypothetical protein
MNQEKLFTEKFDVDFLEIGTYDEDPNDIGFYKNFPQMMPWVGSEFENKEHKKILFIGESHYLPEYLDDEDLLTPNGWYNQGEDNLDENSNEYSWTNTREIVGLKKREKGHSLYREVEKAIRNAKGIETNLIEDTNMFKYVGYYNYFLRPAYKNDSIKKTCIEWDLKIAHDAFENIIGILKPDYVYFLSVFAWESYKRYNNDFKNIIIDYSPHPACPWWNTKKYKLNDKNELLTGKEKLNAFLRENKVFDKEN